MYGFLFRFLTAVAFHVLPLIAFGGGHDSLSCNGCHSLHNAKTPDFILGVEPNSKDLNPKTGLPYGGSTAVCLRCHQTPAKGGRGMTAVNGSSSHPFGLTSINPRIARVPPELIRNGRFECSSCHDPHPVNPNRKYLIIDTSGTGSMEKFCTICHSKKADQKATCGMSGGGSVSAPGNTEAGAGQKRR